MKALSDKIMSECKMSKTLRDSAWEEEDYIKAKEMRKQQQFHWEKFNFMKELNKALEKKGE